MDQVVFPLARLETLATQDRRWFGAHDLYQLATINNVDN